VAIILDHDPLPGIFKDILTDYIKSVLFYNAQAERVVEKITVVRSHMREDGLMMLVMFGLMIDILCTKRRERIQTDQSPINVIRSCTLSYSYVN